MSVPRDGRMSISARDRRMYELALRVAEDSECNSRHGAVIAKGSRVLSLAVNRQEQDRAVPDGHAEIRALGLRGKTGSWFRIGGARHELLDATLYSARDATLPLSKPCENCQTEMRRLGVRRCVYHDGWSLQELKV
jgi:tRNA(Arg) A34 adenosine deaminase TadA